MPNPNCPHNVAISLPRNNDPKLSSLRMCLNCGAEFILTPIALRDDPRCKEILDITAKEIKENLPKYG